MNLFLIDIVGNKDLLENDVKSLIQKMESSRATGSTSCPPTAETSSVPKSNNKQPVTSKNKENAPKQRKRKPKTDDDDSLEIKKNLSKTKVKKGNTEKKRPSQSEKAELLKAKNTAANLAGLQFLQSSGLIQPDQDSLNLPRPITQKTHILQHSNLHHNQICCLLLITVPPFYKHQTLALLHQQLHILHKCNRAIL